MERFEFDPAAHDPERSDGLPVTGLSTVEMPTLARCIA
jgi:hypothetical protein